MNDSRVRIAIGLGLPPLLFVVAMIMGWHATGPDRAGIVADSTEETRRLSPRQRKELSSDKPSPSKLSLMEARMYRPNPKLPFKQYDARGMEAAIKVNPLTLNPPDHRHHTKYAERWARTDPEEMFKWLKVKDGKRIEEADRLFHAWMKQSPERALAAVFEITDQTLRAQALLTSLNYLAKKHPDRANRMLEENLNLYSAAPMESVHYDYKVGQEAIDLVSSLPPSQAKTHLLVGMINDMGKHELTSECWNGLSNSEKSELVDAGAGKTLFRRFEYEGMEDLLRRRAEVTGDPELIDSVFSNFSRSWVQRDFEDAQNWVNSQVKGKDRMHYSNRLWYIAAQQDLDQAIERWQSLPPGHFKSQMSGAIQRGFSASEQKDIRKRLYNK